MAAAVRVANCEGGMAVLVHVHQLVPSKLYALLKLLLGRLLKFVLENAGVEAQEHLGNEDGACQQTLRRVMGRSVSQFDHRATQVFGESQPTAFIAVSFWNPVAISNAGNTRRVCNVQCALR